MMGQVKALPPFLFVLSRHAFCFEIFSDDKLESDRFIGGFQSCDIDLAVALHRVRVSRPDEASFLEDRKEKDGTCLQLRLIQIAAKRSWRNGIKFSSHRLSIVESAILTGHPSGQSRGGATANNTWKRLEL